jgi:hypothetical protein
MRPGTYTKQTRRGGLLTRRVTVGHGLYAMPIEPGARSKERGQRHSAWPHGHHMTNKGGAPMIWGLRRFAQYFIKWVFFKQEFGFFN